MKDNESKTKYMRSTPDVLREAQAAYRSSVGPYTDKDYYALPKERRAELIDGWIYDMAAPTNEHQLILGELFVQFRECIRKSGMPCKVYFAPLDVRLDGDNRTIVQPDLIVICDQTEGIWHEYQGVPELIAEILSESNRAHDLLRKLNKYRNAGVKEYWIVDPRDRKVLLHTFNRTDSATEYSFSAVIPVGISNGTCSIEFSKISALL